MGLMETGDQEQFINMISLKNKGISSPFRVGENIFHVWVWRYGDFAPGGAVVSALTVAPSAPFWPVGL